MPNVFYVTPDPVDFSVTGGWVRKETWTPKIDVTRIAPEQGADGKIKVVSTLQAAQTLALGREGLKKGKGCAILEIEYTGQALSADVVSSAADGSQKVKVYPIPHDKLGSLQAVHLDHIHRSLKNVNVAPSASFDDDDEAFLLSGESQSRPQPSRTARFMGGVRSSLSSASSTMTGYFTRRKDAEYRDQGYSLGAESHAAKPTLLKRIGAGFKAAGRSILESVKKWGPVFLMAAAGITAFYFLGGTAALMKLGYSLGLKTAGAATLTTVATLGFGMASIALCRAAYRGVKGASHYGRASYARVSEVVVNYKTNRAKSANDAEHDLVVKLAGELGRKLADKQADPVPAAYEEAYVDLGLDESHKAQLLQRERKLFEALRAAGDDETSQKKALAQGQADLDSFRQGVAAERRVTLGVS